MISWFEKIQQAITTSLLITRQGTRLVTFVEGYETALRNPGLIYVFAVCLLKCMSSKEYQIFIDAEVGRCILKMHQQCLSRCGKVSWESLKGSETCLFSRLNKKQKDGFSFQSGFFKS